jgi:hypothetical protein
MTAVFVALRCALGVAQSIERRGVFPGCAPGFRQSMQTGPCVQQERAIVLSDAGEQDRERTRFGFKGGTVPGAWARAAAAWMTAAASSSSPSMTTPLLDPVAKRCDPVPVFDHRDLVRAVHDIPQRCARANRAEQLVTASDVRWLQVIRQDAAFPEECSGALRIRDHRRKATVICLDELGPLVIRPRIGTALMLEDDCTLPLASPSRPPTPCHADMGGPIGTQKLVETRCKEDLGSPLTRPVVRPLAGVGAAGHGDPQHIVGTVPVRCSRAAGPPVHDAFDRSIRVRRSARGRHVGDFRRRSFLATHITGS